MNAHSPWASFAEVNGFPEANGFPELDAPFDIGDVVSLIVGGPDMVVIGVCECGTVEVAWADSDGDVCVDVFPDDALAYVD